MIGLLSRLAVIAPGELVTVYETIEAPPVSAGAVKPTSAVVELAPTDETAGASGTWRTARQKAVSQPRTAVEHTRQRHCLS